MIPFDKRWEQLLTNPDPNVYTKYRSTHNWVISRGLGESQDGSSIDSGEDTDRSPEKFGSTEKFGSPENSVTRKVREFGSGVPKNSGVEDPNQEDGSIDLINMQRVQHGVSPEDLAYERKMSLRNSPQKQVPQADSVQSSKQGNADSKKFLETLKLSYQNNSGKAAPTKDQKSKYLARAPS